MHESQTLPVLDVAPLFDAADRNGRARAAAGIRAACRDHGFFYAVGHGVPSGVMANLRDAARAFFALPDERKLEIAMARGGRPWRRDFPLGGELTSDEPNLKEGLYFGTELPPEHPRVRAGIPLHGANLFPDDVPELRPAVLAFMSAATRSAHAILEGVALALDLDADYFRAH